MIKLTFSGDLLVQSKTLESVKTAAGYDFDDIFRPCKQALNSDFLVGNLETPVAGEALGYTSERYRFNTPESFLDTLRKTGFHMLTLANNHVMDRGEAGILNTLAACRKYGFAVTGANDTPDEAQRICLQTVGGVRIAFVNYTYGTNAFHHHCFLSPEHRYMVNLYQPEETLPGSMEMLQSSETIAKSFYRLYMTDDPVYAVVQPYLTQLQRDMQRAKAQADLVVAVMHCGGQNNEAPDAYTRYIASLLRAYGADLIVGHHPHVVQSCEKADGVETVFCLGNLLCWPEDADEYNSQTYSAVLHAYVDERKKRIDRLTFRIMKTVVADGKVHVWDGYTLCRTTPDEHERRLQVYYANKFVGRKQFGDVQEEYPL